MDMKQFNVSTNEVDKLTDVDKSVSNFGRLMSGNFFKNGKEEILVSNTTCTITFPTTKSVNPTKYYSMRTNFDSFQVSGYLDKGFVVDNNDWMNLNNATSITTGNLGGTRNVVNNSFSFMTDSMEILLKLYYNPKFIIAIDDVLYSDSSALQGVTSTDQAPSSWVNITFPTQKIRKVTIRVSAYSFSIGGVYVLPTRKLWNPNLYSPRVFYVGDSFSTGTSSNIPGSTYTDRIDQYCGWITSNVNGMGGTGFVNETEGSTIRYLKRFNDLITFNPDILILQASLNDNSNTYGVIYNAVKEYLTIAKAYMKDKPIIILGVCGRADSDAIKNEQAISAVLNELKLENVYFIPAATATDPFIYGTGNVGKLKNDGNADWVIANDGTHFTPEGFIYYAKRMSTEIKRLYL